MLRTSIMFFAALALSFPVLAHPEPDASTKQSPKTLTAKPTLPSQAELQKALAELPDMNAIMGDMLSIVKDETLHNQMKRTGETFAKRIENSGALEMRDDNGLPDFNAAFGVMISMIGEEDGFGAMLDTMTSMAEQMERVTETHIPKAKE